MDNPSRDPTPRSKRTICLNNTTTNDNNNIMNINNEKNSRHPSMSSRDPTPRSKRTICLNNNNNTDNNNNIMNINNEKNSRHPSMSDTDYPTSQAELYGTPPQSFPKSDEPSNDHSSNTNAKSIVSADVIHSPRLQAEKPNFPASAPPSGRASWPYSEKIEYPASEGNQGRGKKSALENHDPYAGINRLSRADEQVEKVVADGGLEEGQMVLRLRRENESAGSRRATAVVFRVFEMAACLISFSVMAADKTQGWAGDSYDRYVEYRYCLAVNIIGFLYSGFQALRVGCQMGSGDHRLGGSWRLHFDFSMDQILAYLVLSASSSAATRVTDWMLNWGKDDFTLMATASIAMSFLAFIAFGISSVISAYNLFNHRDS